MVNANKKDAHVKKDVKKFEVSGFIKKLNRPFKKVVEAGSENFAVHKVLSLFGANNGVKRSQIVVESVKEMKG